MIHLLFLLASGCDIRFALYGPTTTPSTTTTFGVPAPYDTT